MTRSMRPRKPAAKPAIPAKPAKATKDATPAKAARAAKQAKAAKDAKPAKATKDVVTMSTPVYVPTRQFSTAALNKLKPAEKTIWEMNGTERTAEEMRVIWDKANGRETHVDGMRRRLKSFETKLAAIEEELRHESNQRQLHMNLSNGRLTNANIAEPNTRKRKVVIEEDEGSDRRAKAARLETDTVVDAANPIPDYGTSDVVMTDTDQTEGAQIQEVTDGAEKVDRPSRGRKLRPRKAKGTVATQNPGNASRTPNSASEQPAKVAGENQKTSGEKPKLSLPQSQAKPTSLDEGIKATRLKEPRKKQQLNFPDAPKVVLEQFGPFAQPQDLQGNYRLVPWSQHLPRKLPHMDREFDLGIGDMNEALTRAGSLAQDAFTFGFDDSVGEDHMPEDRKVQIVQRLCEVMPEIAELMTGVPADESVRTLMEALDETQNTKRDEFQVCAADSALTTFWAFVTDRILGSELLPRFGAPGTTLSEQEFRVKYLTFLSTKGEYEPANDRFIWRTYRKAYLDSKEYASESTQLAGELLEEFEKVFGVFFGEQRNPQLGKGWGERLTKALKMLIKLRCQMELSSHKFVVTYPSLGMKYDDKTMQVPWPLRKETCKPEARKWLQSRPVRMPLGAPTVQVQQTEVDNVQGLERWEIEREARGTNVKSKAPAVEPFKSDDWDGYKPVGPNDTWYRAEVQLWIDCLPSAFEGATRRRLLS